MVKRGIAATCLFQPAIVGRRKIERNSVFGGFVFTRCLDFRTACALTRAQFVQPDGFVSAVCTTGDCAECLADAG